MNTPSIGVRFDVVIAGASFTGLALAGALSRALGPDLRLAIIDRNASPGAGPVALSPAPDARASALSAASRHVLSALGVWDGVADAAEPVLGIEITDSPLDAGVRPVLLTYDNHLPEDGLPATHIVPNAVLLDALRQMITARPDITWLAPEGVAGVDSTATGVSLTLESGTVVETALVIAADGRRSQVRAAAGITVVGWGYPQVGIVTTVAHERPHRGLAVQHFLPAGPFAILPLRGNRSCITWTEDATEARRILTLDDDGFLAEVDRRFGGRLGALSLDGPRQSWPLDMHLARRFVAPRVALVGDAAHGVHPIAGQGLNLALRDVAALAECVADAMRLGLEAGDAMALERYERWRRFDSTLSAATFDGLNRLFSSDIGLLRSAREAGLGIVDRFPALKRMLVQEAAGVAGELPRLVRGLPI